jgi:hypothetical protein
MKRPLDKMDPNRYRFVELYEFKDQKTKYDFLFVIIGFGIIAFLAWVSSL